MNILRKISNIIQNAKIVSFNPRVSLFLNLFRLARITHVTQNPLC